MPGGPAPPLPDPEGPAMPTLLALDVGTSGTKAALIAADGSILGSAFEPYPTRYPRPLWAEQDPAEWWAAVAVATRAVMQRAGARPAELLGLSFSTQMLNTIPVDARGVPLRPAISWLDGRAVEEARWVMRRLGGPGIFALIVGAALTGKDLLPKFVWLKRNEPEIYRRADALYDASSYLLHRATGRRVAEWSVASVTGLFNLKSKTWDTGLMRFFGLDPAKFPELVHACERVGGLTAEAAGELGLLPGTPVFAGAGDAQCAAVGSGAVGESAGHLCLGTSGFVGVITSRRTTGRRGIATIQSADRGRLLLIAETETCGACLKWAAQQLYGLEPQDSAYAHMDARVAAEAPGAGGLLFTPWMYGERAPVSDERLRASFVNLGANHTRDQMARAIYEGVAYNLRWILESIEQLYGFRPDPLRVIGGGARGLPWLQIVADVSGRTLEALPHPQESAAIGAALIGAVGAGVYPSIEATRAVIQPGAVVSSDPSRRPLYDELYHAFRRLYGALRDLHHQLNRPPEAPGA